MIHSAVYGMMCFNSISISWRKNIAYFSQFLIVDRKEDEAVNLIHFLKAWGSISGFKTMVKDVFEDLCVVAFDRGC